MKKRTSNQEYLSTARRAIPQKGVKSEVHFKRGHFSELRRLINTTAMYACVRKSLHLRATTPSNSYANMSLQWPFQPKSVTQGSRFHTCILNPKARIDRPIYFVDYWHLAWCLSQRWNMSAMNGTTTAATEHTLHKQQCVCIFVEMSAGCSWRLAVMCCSIKLNTRHKRWTRWMMWLKWLQRPNVHSWCEMHVGEKTVAKSN